MARELAYLLGLGLRQFSMFSAQVPSVKQRVLTTSLPEIAPSIQKILRTDDPMKIRELLGKLNA
jgi:phosphotransferase system enzyme I (PtsI)